MTGTVTDRDLKRASASDATTLEVHELLYLLSNLKVYIRMYGIDRPKRQKLQDELITTAQLLYLVDHRENKRVIF